MIEAFFCYLSTSRLFKPKLVNYSCESVLNMNLKIHFITDQLAHDTWLPSSQTVKVTHLFVNIILHLIPSTCSKISLIMTSLIVTVAYCLSRFTIFDANVTSVNCSYILTRVTCYLRISAVTEEFV